MPLPSNIGLKQNAEPQHRGAMVKEGDVPMLAFKPESIAVALEYPDAATTGPLIKSPPPLVTTNPPVKP